MTTYCPSPPSGLRHLEVHELHVLGNAPRWENAMFLIITVEQNQSVLCSTCTDLEKALLGGEKAALSEHWHSSTSSKSTDRYRHGGELPSKAC